MLPITPSIFFGILNSDSLQEPRPTIMHVLVSSSASYSRPLALGVPHPGQNKIKKTRQHMTDIFTAFSNLNPLRMYPEQDTFSYPPTTAQRLMYNKSYKDYPFVLHLARVLTDFLKVSKTSFVVHCRL